MTFTATNTAVKSSQHSGVAAEGLTSRESVPHLQPVVLAVAISTWQGIVLQVKGEEGEGDIHAGGYDDNEGALQVVGILVRKTRGLDEARRAGEVPGTVGT